MAGSHKNPFEVFGITPEITSRLGEKDLFALIKAVYRTLLKIYHPDHSQDKSPKAKAKSTAQAVEINLAYEKLNLDKDATSFHRCQRLYAARQTRGLRKKIARLEADLRKHQAEQGILANGFMLYLLKGLPWLSENGGETWRSALNPTNLKLGLTDVAINQNVRAASWSLGSNYKEIIFDALGAMYYRPVGRTKPFPVNYIHLLGVVTTSEIELLPLLDRVPPREGFFKCPALDSRCGLDGPPIQVLNTMTVDKFKHYCLPLLQPELKERSYLFSVHRPTLEQEDRVSLEGVIIKISKP